MRADLVRGAASVSQTCFEESKELGLLHPFHYGSHYSTRGIVLGYMGELLSWSYRRVIQATRLTSHSASSVRVEPYTSYYLWFNRQFDERTFRSVADSWLVSSSVGKHVKEVTRRWCLCCCVSASQRSPPRRCALQLIPEFFCLPEMFLNMNHVHFGSSHSGAMVDDVELPVWAHGRCVAHRSLIGPARWVALTLFLSLVRM